MADKISGELLMIIQSSQRKVRDAQVSYQSVLREVAELYKLNQGDNIDLASGEITRQTAEMNHTPPSSDVFNDPEPAQVAAS